MDGYQVRPEDLHAVADILSRAGQALDQAGSEPAPAMDAAGQAMGELSRLVGKLSRHAGEVVVACGGYAHELTLTASAYHARDTATGMMFDRMGDGG